jgi:hypothetical protein
MGEFILLIIFSGRDLLLSSAIYVNSLQCETRSHKKSCLMLKSPPLKVVSCTPCERTSQGSGNRRQVGYPPTFFSPVNVTERHLISAIHLFYHGTENRCSLPCSYGDESKGNMCLMSKPLYLANNLISVHFCIISKWQWQWHKILLRCHQSELSKTTFQNHICQLSRVASFSHSSHYCCSVGREGDQKITKRRGEEWIHDPRTCRLYTSHMAELAPVVSFSPVFFSFLVSLPFPNSVLFLEIFYESVVVICMIRMIRTKIIWCIDLERIKEALR